MWHIIGLAASLFLTPIQSIQYTHPADNAWQYPQTRDGLSCAPKVVTPPVEIKSERNEPNFTYSQSTQDLTRLSAAGGTYRPPGATGPSWHTGGLTQGMFTFTSNVPAQVVTSSDGVDCIIVQKIEFKIVLTPQVWVANDYAPGTCMYNAVHEHEMKHVNVDRAVSDRHLPQMHAALIQLSQNRGFFGPGSQAQVKAEYDQFVQQLGEVIKDQVAAMQTEDTRAQQQVDTLQEYERINHLCASQLREMGR